MDHGDPPRPAVLARVKKQRKVAAGSGGEQQRRLLELGDTLEALVRAVASADSLAEGLARRSHELWLEQRAHAIEWRPTELRCDGKLVLAVDSQAGRFVFPAYTAGLRALGLRRRSVPSDLVRLASQLALLLADETAPPEFAQFFYRNGALGFDASLELPDSELGALLVAPESSESALWAARSARAIEAWHEQSERAAHALPESERHARFALPLAALEARERLDTLALRAEAAAALVRGAEDAARWAELETGLVCEQSSLRPALDGAHLSFLLAGWIEARAPLSDEFWARCAMLAAPSPEHAARQEGEFDFALIGRAAGQRLLDEKAPEAAFTQLFERAPAPLADALFSLLVEQSDERSEARDALGVLFRRLGASAFFERADPARISPRLGLALVPDTLATDALGGAVLAALEHMPAATVIAILGARPGLIASAERLLARLVSEQPLGSGPWLADLVDASPDGARAVGSALLLSKAAGVAQGALRAAFSALVRRGLGARYVLPLWQARAASDGARIAALHALEQDPALLSRALSDAGAGLLEPPEIREVLEELRWRRPG